MSYFTITTITTQGINIIAKLVAGQNLNFDHIEVGDGALGGTNPQSKTALSNKILDIPITSISAKDGTARVRGTFTNSALQTGFFYRELGLFVKDPATNKIVLYAYANAEENAEYIPPAGTETIIEKIINLNTIVGNATNVSAVLKSGIYITTEDLETAINNHNNDLDAHAVLYGNSTLYVDAASGSDANPGTETAPLATIQAALNKTPKDGDVGLIFIRPGTYAEKVEIPRNTAKYLELRGTETTQPIITSIKADTGHYIRLINLAINGQIATGGAAIGVGNCNVQVDTCTLTGPGTGVGIGINGGGLIVQSTKISGYATAVQVAYGSTANTRGNTYTNNTKDMHAYGGVILTSDTTTKTNATYGGAVINLATGQSLTAGVADSTTVKNDTTKKLATTEWVRKADNPVGAIIFAASSTAPAGYLVANGAAISRTTYAELFAAIGTTYGAGNGSTTFTLPDLRDRVAQGSATAGTYKAAGLPNITGYAATITGINLSDIGNDVTPRDIFKGAINNHPWGEKFTSNRTANNAGPDYNFQIRIDASKSNSIYGNSTTVQPPALTLLPCIKY